MKSPVKITLGSELISLVLIGLSVVLSFYFYSNMPEIVPTHWNFAGVADGWSSRGFAAFFFPCLILGIYGLFLFLPSIDPHKNRYKEFEKIYHNIKSLVIFILTAIYIVTGLIGIGYKIPVEYYVPYFVGVLFFFIGLQLKDIKPNWFMGIRTPWTMSSDRVWEKTHKFGGIMFMLGGVLMAFSGWMPAVWRVPALAFTMIALLGGIMTYSYFVYRQEKK